MHKLLPCCFIDKPQVAVVGSYSDLLGLERKESIRRIAWKVGYLIAKQGWVLVCGGEKDGGLVREAMKGAKAANGLIVGVVRDLEDIAPEVDIVINASGPVGFREYLLAVSSRAMVVISGGSGTLNEVSVAYQNRIPIVALKGTGGWADKLANKYLDSRKKVKIVGVSSPKEAVAFLKKIISQ